MSDKKILNQSDKKKIMLYIANKDKDDRRFLFENCISKKEGVY